MVTDLKYLQQMTGNDSEVMREMIELFLTQLSEIQDDIGFLVDSKNWFELSRLAHKIKSSALVMGIEQMAADMRELEVLTKEGQNTDLYPAYIARFHEMADLVKADMRKYLDS